MYNTGVLRTVIFVNSTHSCPCLHKCQILFHIVILFESTFHGVTDKNLVHRISASGLHDTQNKADSQATPM